MDFERQPAALSDVFPLTANFSHQWFFSLIHYFQTSTPVSGVSLHLPHTISLFMHCFLLPFTFSVSLLVTSFHSLCSPSLPVLPYLKHLALISRITGSLSFSSALHTFFACFLPSFTASFLQRMRLHAVTWMQAGMLKACQ